MKQTKNNRQKYKKQNIYKYLITLAITVIIGILGYYYPELNQAIQKANEISNKSITEIANEVSTRGLENDLVPRAGYDLKTIEAYGLSKKISIENFKKICTTLKATGKARKIIQEFRPDIIVGAGGYICGPVVWAASKEKIPVVLHESNAFPGKAIKVLSKKANTVFKFKRRIKKYRNRSIYIQYR